MEGPLHLNAYDIRPLWKARNVPGGKLIRELTLVEEENYLPGL